MSPNGDRTRINGRRRPRGHHHRRHRQHRLHDHPRRRPPPPAPPRPACTPPRAGAAATLLLHAWHAGLLAETIVVLLTLRLERRRGEHGDLLPFLHAAEDLGVVEVAGADEDDARLE